MINRILNNIFLTFILLFIICCNSVDNHEKPDIWKVYYLGGQSNMDDYGSPVSAGIYLYQIQAGEFVHTKKMVLLK